MVYTLRFLAIVMGEEQVFVSGLGQASTASCGGSQMTTTWRTGAGTSLQSMATAVVGAPKCVSGTKQLKKVSVGIWKAVSSATGTGTSCQPMRTARAKGRSVPVE